MVSVFLSSCFSFGLQVLCIQTSATTETIKSYANQQHRLKFSYHLHRFFNHCVLFNEAVVFCFTAQCRSIKIFISSCIIIIIMVTNEPNAVIYQSHSRSEIVLLIVLLARSLVTVYLLHMNILVLLKSLAISRGNNQTNSLILRFKTVFSHTFIYISSLSIVTTNKHK